jgi:anti-sigma B factor antagonist
MRHVAAERHVRTGGHAVSSLLIQEEQLQVGDVDVPVLALVGDLDVHTAPALRKALYPAVTQATAKGTPVVVDLQGLRFMDSTGLGVIVGAGRGGGADAAQVHLVSAQPRVLRLLQITGVVEALPVHPDRASLHAHLKG